MSSQLIWIANYAFREGRRESRLVLSMIKRKPCRRNFIKHCRYEDDNIQGYQKGLLYSVNNYCSRKCKFLYARCLHEHKSNVTWDGLPILQGKHRNSVCLNLTSEMQRDYTTQICNTSLADTDLYSNVKNDISDMLNDIRQELRTPIGNLEGCSNYYFDGQGKYIRPTTIFLAAKLCNVHTLGKSNLSYGQKRIAMISEMIHTASLLHDDVIDEATTRRGKQSVNMVFTDKQTILAGDFILSRASIALARLGNCRAVELIAEIIEDLVKGEIMQLFIDDDPKKRFSDYLEKTYFKTASLLANSCKAAAVLGDAGEDVQDILFRFGKNIGIAFQLVDDTLDFTSTSDQLGKPVTADLSLGLATAPVLYAAERFPELEPLISRRFSEKSDVQKAFYYVNQSNGISQTMDLAANYIKEAINSINLLRPCPERDCLVDLANFVLKRKK